MGGGIKVNQLIIARLHESPPSLFQLFLGPFQSHCGGDLKCSGFCQFRPFFARTGPARCSTSTSDGRLGPVKRPKECKSFCCLSILGIRAQGLSLFSVFSAKRRETTCQVLCVPLPKSPNLHFSEIGRSIIEPPPILPRSSVHAKCNTPPVLDTATPESHVYWRARNSRTNNAMTARFRLYTLFMCLDVAAPSHWLAQRRIDPDGLQCENSAVSC